MTWLILLAPLLLLFGFVVFYGAPYVPSRKQFIRQAFCELYQLSDKDLLIDIGSGDGVVLREASKLNARAIGYEINPLLVYISRFLSRNDDKVRVLLKNHWICKLPKDTTIVYAFSVNRDINKINKWLQAETNRLKKPIKLISFGFRIDGKKEEKCLGAYYLYSFNPLQLDEAQV